MCGQAASCGGVGPSGKRRANQLATAGWNSDSGEASCTLPFHQEVVTPTTVPAAGTVPAESGRPHQALCLWISRMVAPGNARAGDSAGGCPGRGQVLRGPRVTIEDVGHLGAPLVDEGRGGREVAVLTRGL